jgi:secreted trypsin-like serine protease
VLAIAGCALLAGCVAGAPELASTTQAIIGGTNDTTDPSVVTLYGADGSSAFLCTASVIAPTVLLTAAHCVTTDLHSSMTKYYAYLGDDFNQAKPADMHVALEAHANPMWNQNDLTAGHDVGIVILAEPLSLPSLPLRRTPLSATDMGATIRLVGYGANDGATQGGVGVKRQTTTALDSFDDVTITYNDTMHLTCDGDSGGPAFLSRNGTEEIIGLTSFGDVNCTMFGVDTRVDAEIAFIDGYLQQASSMTAVSAPDAGSVSSSTPASGSKSTIVSTDMAGTEPGVLPEGSYTHGSCSMGGRARAADALALALLAVIALLLRRR